MIEKIKMFHGKDNEILEKNVNAFLEKIAISPKYHFIDIKQNVIGGGGDIPTIYITVVYSENKQ